MLYVLCVQIVSLCELHMHALHERIRAITAYIYIYIYIVLIYQRCVISSTNARYDSNCILTSLKLLLY